MDLQGLGHKSIEDITAETLWLKSTAKEKKEGSIVEDLILGVDSASASELDKLKSQSLEAKEPGRAAYIESLKAAIAKGDYDVATDKLTDALIDDGFMEFFID